MLRDAATRRSTNSYRDALLGSDAPPLPEPVNPLEAIRTSMSKLKLNPPNDIRSGKSVMAKLMFAAREAQIEGRDDREAFGRDVRKSGFDALEIRRMGAFMGIPMHVVPDDITRVTLPVKEHKDRGELRRHRLFGNFVYRPSGYHNRIQKKWNKRYGFKTVDRVYFLDQPTFGPTKAQKVMVVVETYFQRIRMEARDLGVL